MKTTTKKKRQGKVQQQGEGDNSYNIVEKYLLP